jgi:hypothetical protein
MSYISRAALGAVSNDPFANMRPTAPTNYGTPAAPPPNPLANKAITAGTAGPQSSNPLDFLKKIGGSGSSNGSFMDNFFKNLTGGGSGGPLQAALSQQQPYQAATAPAPSGKILGLSPTMLAIAGAAVIGGVLFLRKK